MSKPLITLHIEHGKIPVKLVDNGRCGGVDDAFIVDYDLGVRELDEDGYVIEVHAFNTLLAERFHANGKPLRASCEQLAMGVVSVAAERLPGLESAWVKVYNLTGSIRVEWKAGDEVPEFPRVATANEARATPRPSGYRPPQC